MPDSTTLACRIVFCSLALIFTACGGGGGGDSEDTGGDSALSPATPSAFSPACGVVRETVTESVDPEEGVFYANASAIAPNVVAVDPGTGPLVIKLLALDFSNQSQVQQLAVNRLNQLVAGGVYYFPRLAPCSVTTPTGGVGTSGQLFTPDGTDVAEQLIREGLSGSISSSGSCGEELIGPCYANLKATVTPQNAGLVTEFLWKPSSEGEFAPGKLAVLINADPCNVIIVVNGEILQNYGPTNGRCMTSRSLTKSGCEYGANAKVEIFNADSGLPYIFPDGNLFIINPNGCERLQYKL